MSACGTQIELQTSEGTNVETDSIRIRRVISQGDSLGPVWCCLEMNPPSQSLNSSNHGAVLNNNNIEFNLQSLVIYR